MIVAIALIVAIIVTTGAHLRQIRAQRRVARDRHAARVDHRLGLPDLRPVAGAANSAARRSVAMAALLSIAYAAGCGDPLQHRPCRRSSREAPFNDPIAWTARVTQGVLALAYAVSVAYYLKLLAEFSLMPSSASAKRL